MFRIEHIEHKDSNISFFMLLCNEDHTWGTQKQVSTSIKPERDPTLTVAHETEWAIMLLTAF